jgi:hypothetical protein
MGSILKGSSGSIVSSFMQRATTGLDRLRLRGPNGAKDEFLMAATAQNLRKLAKLVPLPAPTVAA